MTNPRKVEECKSLLFKLAIKHGVAPRLISGRLLSKEDKDDMLNGLFTFETLDCMVGMWKENGMCDYANGNMTPYKPHSASTGKG